VENNYCQFSCWMEIPKEKKELAEDIIVKAYDELGITNDYPEDYIGRTIAEIQCDEHKCGVWFHEEESGNPEDVEFIARKLIDYLEINEPFYCSWAYTCSKPRINEFGGGALVMKRKYDTYWCDATEFVRACCENNMMNELYS